MTDVTDTQSGGNTPTLSNTPQATKDVDQDELDDVFAKYHAAVNMSASELEAWAENPCSREASQDRSPITRNLRLLQKNKADWTDKDITDANKTIGFVARMSNDEQGEDVTIEVDGRERNCGSRRDISLKNWAFNPQKGKAMKTYMNSPLALKAFEDGRIGGYLIRYGNAHQKDLEGEYFTPETNFELGWYPNRPVLFHHGLADEGTTAIGVITDIRPNNEGLWAEAILDINHEDTQIRQFARRAYALVKAGKLGWSSGSTPHLVKTDRDGRITRWPIVEGSLTPTPAEPGGRTSVSALKSATKACLDLHTPDSLHDNAAAPLTPDTAIEVKAITKAEAKEAIQAPKKEAKPTLTPYAFSKLLIALESAEVDAATQLKILKQFQVMER